MAREIFISNIVNHLLDKLRSLLVDKICSAWSAQSETEKLKSSLVTIQAMLSDAEEWNETDHHLNDWLGRFKEAFYDAEDVLDELQYETLQSQMPTPARIKRKVSEIFTFTGDKLKAIREKLEEISEEKGKFHFKGRSVGKSVSAHGEGIDQTHSFVRPSTVVGRNDDKERIVQLLMHPGAVGNVSIIPIVGIGGLGKTTLAKLVYNDEGVKKHFNLKMWVCVSHNFDVTRLTRDILKAATRQSCDGLSFDQLQTDLRSTLANKKFLLILDNVWKNDQGKWMELMDLLLDGANGSKIVVTTREQSINSIRGAIPAYNLKGLRPEDSLSLFMKWAFKEGEENLYPNLKNIGEDIVRKCVGVPLALKTLGSHLRLDTDEREWLRVKDSEIWKLEQKDGILPALKLSYEHMPSYLKHCFSLCSIFPKDVEIYEVDLIQVWMAHGLIGSSNDNQELEDIGVQYIKKLQSLCFFEDFEYFGPFLILKMHNIVHELALLVAKNECCTLNSNVDNVSQRVRHVSLCGKDSLSLNDVPNSLLNLNKLRTIFFPIWVKKNTSKSFAEASISKFKYLRLLDLNSACFEELPSSVGDLKHLRYLDLSFNDMLKKLPDSIGKLLNLLTLRLQFCWKLEEFPREMGNLINLRFLLLTTLNELLPEEVIGCLTSLRYLGLSDCYNLKSLGERMLERLIALRTLAVWNCENLESLPRSVIYLPTLETLFISGAEKLTITEWEDDIQSLKLRIRSFFIGFTPQLVTLPEWLQGAANTLRLLHIEGCDNLRALPEWLQNFQSLQKLEIAGCRKLSALPEGMDRLTALEELKIKWCSEELKIKLSALPLPEWMHRLHKIILEDKTITYRETCSQPDDTKVPWDELSRFLRRNERAALADESLAEEWEDEWEDE